MLNEFKIPQSLFFAKDCGNKWRQKAATFIGSAIMHKSHACVPLGVSTFISQL